VLLISLILLLMADCEAKDSFEEAMMSADQEGLLTDVANAVGFTLGRVAAATTKLVRTAKGKASGTARRRRPRKRTHKISRIKGRARATAATAKRASGKASRSAKRMSKATARRAQATARKTRRTLRAG
jgi:hypothetical protein